MLMYFLICRTVLPRQWTTASILVHASTLPGGDIPYHSYNLTENRGSVTEYHPFLQSPTNRLGVSSASPDKWVVNGYPLLHETTYLRASFDRRRARNLGGGIAFAGCLHLAPLPDLAQKRRWPKRLPDRPQPRL